MKILLPHTDILIPVSEVLLADQTSNLCALDSRTGRVLYGYKGRWTFNSYNIYQISSMALFPGISGGITSLACAPDYVGSTSLDRFFRLHGTASETSVNKKGQTLEKVYTKSIPTVVAWDPSHEDSKSGDGEGEEDQVWRDMANAEDDGDSDDEGKEDSDGEGSANFVHKKSRTK